MLKRILCVGSFSHAVLISVLTTHVPENLRGVSAELVGKPSTYSIALETYLAECCGRWASDLLLDASGKQRSAGNEYCRCLEEAYLRFFCLCADVSFENTFSRRGSLSVSNSDSSIERNNVFIARRGGYVGVMLKESILDPQNKLLSEMTTEQIAKRILGEYSASISEVEADKTIQHNFDVFSSQLTLFLENNINLAQSDSKGDLYK